MGAAILFLECTLCTMLHIHISLLDKSPDVVYIHLGTLTAKTSQRDVVNTSSETILCTRRSKYA